MSSLMRGRGIAAVAAVTVGLLAATQALALDRRVKIINETEYTIVEFYASNVGTDDWEEDILDEDVLDPGQSVRIDFDDGSGYCKFDFKAVFEDGDKLIKRNVNVCDLGTFRYTD